MWTRSLRLVSGSHNLKREAALTCRLGNRRLNFARMRPDRTLPAGPLLLQFSTYSPLYGCRQQTKGGSGRHTSQAIRAAGHAAAMALQRAATLPISVTVIGDVKYFWFWSASTLTPRAAVPSQATPDAQSWRRALRDPSTKHIPISVGLASTAAAPHEHAQWQHRTHSIAGSQMAVASPGPQVRHAVALSLPSRPQWRSDTPWSPILLDSLCQYWCHRSVRLLAFLLDRPESDRVKAALHPSICLRGCQGALMGAYQGPQGGGAAPTLHMTGTAKSPQTAMNSSVITATNLTSS
ncbi:hypothetical protein O3P69_015067 [Scylla paramamosain]|uniref:Uncharacterized protein n=1 Tax=Scylla paramamosain TaxID=85552 RepID=A0AAW0T2C4_SCYPA